MVFFLLIYSCKNHSEIDVNLNHLNNLADKINLELNSISQDVIELTNKIKYSIHFEEPVVKDFNKSYNYFDDQVLFTRFENNNSAVYYPSNGLITKTLQNRIINTEQLDPLFESIIKSNDLIAQVSFIDTNSFLRIYPYIDVINYLKNSPDLTKLITYQTAYNKIFNSKNAYWINTPFADPYGRGWIISCAEPVYYHDQFKGVIAVDIPIKSIKSKYLSSNTESLFILNIEGKLIACTKEAGKILNAPNYKEFQYFNPVEEDIFIFSSPSLKNHQNKSIREAIENLLKNKTQEIFYIGNKKYKIYKSYIPETNWYLFKIIN